MKIIREMVTSDWERVSEIYTQALERGVSTFNTECPSYEDWDNAHKNECRFVYEKNGVVVGWVVLSPTSARKAYEGVVEVSIYVDEEYRGHGIGTELLNHMCAESEKAGFWCLFSVVLAHNKASLGLHKKCGFREIGYRERIARDKFGNWQNTILFEKRSENI